MGFFQIAAPLALSTRHRWSTPPSATFRKMLLPQMMGVAPLLDGIGSFQAMFSVWLHLMGRFCSLLMPFDEGPRQFGQFSAIRGMERSSGSRATRKTSPPLGALREEYHGGLVGDLTRRHRATETGTRRKP
jgi:hypothetical protein